MTKRMNIPAKTIWEDVVGYSRAVKIGDVIEVSGTAAVNVGEIVGRGNAYEQTKFIIQKIEKALKEAGASLNDVIRTRIFVADISKWEEIGRAHGEFFREIKPATTMVEIKALIDPNLLVEIEASAVIK